MRKIIFVCRGNVIRSQTCKAIYNKLAGDNLASESYGMEVLQDGNEGIKLGDQKFLLNLVKIMKEYGMDISNEVSKQFAEKVLIDNPKIIFMGSRNIIPAWVEKYDYEVEKLFHELM